MDLGTPFPQLRAFIEENTVRGPPALCPEMTLHLVDDLMPLWERTEAELADLRIQTPYWSVAWPGGQALARFILDHAFEVRGKRILDLGAGSGICAIAAAMAGASSVTANDPDPVALTAVALNASSNGVQITPSQGDLLNQSAAQSVDVILAADVWFDRWLAPRVTRWLRQRASEETRVLVGDPKRSYFPSSGLTRLAEFQVPSSAAMEQLAVTRAGVWSLHP